MSEVQNEVTEVEIYGYVNAEGQRVYTPNLEFAYIMATKSGTEHVFIEKK